MVPALPLGRGRVVIQPPEEIKMRMPQRIAAILLAGALSLSAAAFAAKGQKKAAATHVSAALVQTLNLTDDQKASLKSASDALKIDREKAQSLSGKDKRT